MVPPHPASESQVKFSTEFTLCCEVFSWAVGSLVTQLVEKSPLFNDAQKFITMLTKIPLLDPSKALERII
jgi:hypothetical protein